MEISKTKTALYATLHHKKMRTRHGLFLAEGEKCVLDMLGAFEIEALIADPDWLEGKRKALEGYESVTVTASPAVMRKISTLVSQPPLIAVFRVPELVKIDPLDPDALHLMLDGIQDPGNLGTIIRTADWFGFHTIYASRDTADVFNPKTVQAAMGSLKRVKVKYVNLPELIKGNKISRVFGLMLEGRDMFGCASPAAGAVVMGNEGNGLSQEVRELVTDPLLIPPYDPVEHGESLNVGIATGITLAWLRKL